MTIERVDNALALLRGQLQNHPVGTLALPRQALNEFALVQLLGQHHLGGIPRDHA